MSTFASPRGLAEPRTHRDHLSVGDRLRLWCRRRALDAQLAAGVEPRSAVVLERRASQITTAQSRAALAVGFERVLEMAEEPPFTLSSRAPLRRAQVLEARRALLSLANALQGDRAVRAQGVALAQRLLTDVRGPLYTATCAVEIEDAARAAVAAL